MANSNLAAKPAKTVRFNVLEGTANPFVGMDGMGFEPVKVTIEKVLKKGKRKVAAAAAVINKGANYEPLKPDESLWNGNVSRVRLHNIVGGWV
jgi:hypothetical protein